MQLASISRCLKVTTVWTYDTTYVLWCPVNGTECRTSKTSCNNWWWSENRKKREKGRQKPKTESHVSTMIRLPEGNSSPWQKNERRIPDACLGVCFTVCLFQVIKGEISELFFLAYLSNRRSFLLTREVEEKTTPFLNDWIIGWSQYMHTTH